MDDEHEDSVPSYDPLLPLGTEFDISQATEAARVPDVPGLSVGLSACRVGDGFTSVHGSLQRM